MKLLYEMLRAKNKSRRLLEIRKSFLSKKYILFTLIYIQNYGFYYMRHQ